jgi:hypothetical protein
MLGVPSCDAADRARVCSGPTCLPTQHNQERQGDCRRKQPPLGLELGSQVAGARQHIPGDTKRCHSTALPVNMACTGLIHPFTCLQHRKLTARLFRPHATLTAQQLSDCALHRLCISPCLAACLSAGPATATHPCDHWRVWCKRLLRRQLQCQQRYNNL